MEKLYFEAEDRVSELVECVRGYVFKLKVTEVEAAQESRAVHEGRWRKKRESEKQKGTLGFVSCYTMKILI